MWASLTEQDFTAQVDRLQAAMRQAAAQLSPFGLRDWSGPVAFGEWAGTDANIDRVALLHGRLDDPDTPCIQVHTIAGPLPPVVDSLRHGDSTASGEDDEALKLRRAEHHEPHADQQFLVDGRPTQFSVRAAGSSWYAWTAHEERGFLIEAAHVPVSQMALERISDIEPFLDGHRRILQELRSR